MINSIIKNTRSLLRSFFRLKTSKIVIITGSPGVGKSTVSKVLCKKIDNSVYISLDIIRDFVKNGYETPAKLDWNDATFKQGELAREIAAYAAKKYANNGFNVIIDDIVYGDYLDFWMKNLSFYNFDIFLLSCKRNILFKRNKSRKIKVDNEIIIFLEKYFLDFPKRKNIFFIENLNLNLTVKKIIKKSF